MGLIFPFYPSDRLVHITRILGKFVGVQLFVQAVGILSGFLLVRLLTKEDYAYFTIANGMLGMMAVLSDNGISSGLTSIGGKVHADRQQFGQLVNTAIDLRKTLGACALLLVTPALVWMLFRNQASPSQITSLTLAVLACFWLQMGIGVYSVVPRLALQTNRIQSLDLASAAARLALLGIAAITFLNATVAISIAAFALLVQWWMLQRWIPDLVARDAPQNPQHRAEILSIVKQQTPNTLYFCVQGQISLWLISIFGNTQNVAEMGALGRLTVIFTVVTSVVNSLIVPRFARLQDPKQLRRLYINVCIGLLAFGLLLVVAAWFFPTQILWLLGSNYSGLETALLLSLVSGILGAVAGSMYSLNTSRGWIVPPLIAIPIGIITQLVLICILDISTLNGVLWMSILSAPIGMLLCLITASKKITEFPPSP
jgi:O-antigen/teichoic acid export membrane protein